MLYDMSNSFTRFYLCIFLFLFSFQNFNFQIEDYRISNCISDIARSYSLNDEHCFNNVLMFTEKDYQLNHFAKSKNGDLVGEFTEKKEYGDLKTSKLFYRLTESVRYFFPDETYLHEICLDNDVVTCDEDDDVCDDYFYRNNEFNLIN